MATDIRLTHSIRLAAQCNELNVNSAEMSEMKLDQAQEKEHGEDTIREFKLSISKLDDDLEVQRGLADSGKRELAESKVSER